MSTDNSLSETYIIPEGVEETSIKLSEYLGNIARSVNSKDSGTYEQDETVTGKQFIPIFSSDGTSNASYREVFRKVIDFGALPNNSTKSMVHEIEMTNDFSMVSLSGAATKPGATWRPIPYAARNISDTIEISIGLTHIDISTLKDLTAFTRCFIVVEYLKLI